MIYKIYPPIGIARVGDSLTDFFVGPEIPGSPGVDILPDQTETSITKYKTARGQMKRQAARFRIFEFDTPNSVGRPAQFPAGTSVKWTVKLANKKDAVTRGLNPQTETPAHPIVPPLPVLDPNRANRVVSAEASISGASSPMVALDGTYLTTPVSLGSLLTDKDGHLLVLGGHGRSISPENMPIGDEVINGQVGGGFYANTGWIDDVSDGRVAAEISLPGAAPVQATSAWVVVAPPHYAPFTEPVVTLYDVMVQAAVNRREVTLPANPSFNDHIWPLFRRASALFWVNRKAGNQNPPFWSKFSTDGNALSDSSPASAAFRKAQADLVRDIGKNRNLLNFSLRPWQETYLKQWVSGNFVSDFSGQRPGSGGLSTEGLTRAALEAASGQGFFPGIEAGILVTNETIYSEPFRLRDDFLPGDLTALMALPWQADFYECEGAWWPSQRPDSSNTAAAPNVPLEWVRPINQSDTPHRDLVNNFGRLGLVVPGMANGQAIFLESERDPSF